MDILALGSVSMLLQSLRSTDFSRLFVEIKKLLFVYYYLGLDCGLS